MPFDLPVYNFNEPSKNALVRDKRLYDYSSKKPSDESKMSNSDISVEALYELLNAVDWAQTKYIGRNPKKYYENRASWALGSHPTEDKINAFFLLKALAHPAISNSLSGPLKKAFNALSILDTGSAVKNNKSIGIEARF